jgi:hypothetical protein
MLIAGKVTTDPNFIKTWIEKREGTPGMIKNGRGGPKDIKLAVRFPDVPGNEKVVPISWESFFQKFDRERLSFMYEETGPDGALSRFYYFL